MNLELLVLWMLLAVPWIVLVEVLPISQDRRLGLWVLFSLWTLFLALMIGAR